LCTEKEEQTMIALTAAAIATTDAHLIRTMSGKVYIAIDEASDRGCCYLWSPDFPESVSNVPWCDRWETTPLPPDCADVARARAVIAALEERRERAAAQEAARRATYDTWRLTALSCDDLISRGWTLRLIRNNLTPSGKRANTYLYDLVLVTFMEDALREDLERILARRAKRGNG
jgi:hypothetical protein